MIKNTHCKGLITSFKKKIARIAANIGEVYRRVTALPTEIYWMPQKNRIMEVTPTIPL